MKKLLKYTLIVMALFGIVIPESAMAWYGAAHRSGHVYHSYYGPVGHRYGGFVYHNRWHHGPYYNCGHRWTCYYHNGHRVCKNMNVCHSDRNSFYHPW